MLPVSFIKRLSRARWRHPWLKCCLEWGSRLLRNQEGTIEHGAAKGLLFNTGTSNVGYLLGSSDPETQNAFKMLVKPGAVVYDIGANVGFFTIIAASFTGPSGRVFAFEPLQENFGCLEHNVQINGFAHVTASNIALASHDGIAYFMVSKNPTWGKLANVSGAIADEVRQIEVSTARLDSLVQNASLPPPDLIKIDVEGAEVEVLKGAMETIRKNRPVLLIELHGTNAKISELLATLGYFPAVAGGKSILESHWNAQIVAFPEPCAELQRIQSGELAA